MTVMELIRDGRRVALKAIGERMEEGFWGEKQRLILPWPMEYPPEPKAKNDGLAYWIENQ